MLAVEQDQCRLGDLPDAPRVETDPAQGLERDDEQGVGAFSDVKPLICEVDL
ncbi:hypothetical protein [Nonomuraea antimicrobica]|uniref:hypothetical protein n=1 Tax=Nonomuraea antimicrobica TaxID=561173 RepID=UPI0031ECEF55